MGIFFNNYSSHIALRNRFGEVREHKGCWENSERVGWRENCWRWGGLISSILALLILFHLSYRAGRSQWN